MITASSPAPQIPVVSNSGRIIPSLESLSIYYEEGKGFLVGQDGKFIVMNEPSTKRHLRHLGFQAKSAGDKLSEVDAAVHFIQTANNIAYSGPLAGKQPGVFTTGGSRVLVTAAPTIIKASAGGEWGFLKSIIEPMLEAEQLPYLLGWLGRSYNLLCAGTIAPGQVIAFVGPKNSGKTLLQAIITAILGGRTADPYAYMTGRTNFNRDLFAAENLVFGDQVSSTDGRARREFGCRLKQFAVNEDQRCEGKNREALSLRPFWRVTISLNEEQENVCVLPPMDESISDKLMLFVTKRPPVMDCEAWTSYQRTEIWTKIVGELPAFISYLSSFSIPADLRSDRFGVKHFHHPEILGKLSELEPARQLLELIDMHAMPEKGNLVGSASEIERVPKTGPSGVLVFGLV